MIPVRQVVAALVLLLAAAPPVQAEDHARPDLRPPAGAATADGSAPNVIWPTAEVIGPSPAASGTVEATGAIDTVGQDRWYRLAVTPDSRLTVTLRNGGTADRDVAVFADLDQALTRLGALRARPDTQPVARLSAEAQTSVFDPTGSSPSVFVPTGSTPGGLDGARVYDPSLSATFAPSVFSPSVFSPSVFSPSVFSPSLFDPGAFDPDLDPSADLLAAFRGRLDPALTPERLALAFTNAQTQNVLAVSAQTGSTDESVAVNTWNHTGYFYVRVSGRNGAVGADGAFSLQVQTELGLCTVPPDDHRELELWPDPPVSPRSAPGTVLVTDSARLPDSDRLDGPARRFARRADAVIVDLNRSVRIRALNRQADGPGQVSCPLAKNLVAEAARAIVNRYYRVGGRLRYVVVAGDDSVVPFFRYADRAGLGPEHDYRPPVRDVSASGATLQGNYVLGQDAYGAATDVQVHGVPMPVADVAVGRLVKTADEIAATLRRYVARHGRPLRPRSTLVTGYDFLTDAATDIAATFRSVSGGRHDTLIGDEWTADQLRRRLVDRRHDLVFLGGHFSANDTTAADGRTSLRSTAVADAPRRRFADSLVLSIGCHSGYSIVKADGIDRVTDSLDWTQAFAQQGASLVAGTGYQYGDTDFEAYSEKLYAGLARRLRAGRAPVPVGSALLAAKLDYLAGVAELTGIDQKTVLQATLYGLPMLGVAVPRPGPALPRPGAALPGAGLPGAGRAGVAVTATPVPDGPGAALRLSTAELEVAGTPARRQVALRTPDGGTRVATYRVGTSGIVNAPAAPTLPLTTRDVTSRAGVLRGIALLSADYTDTAGVTPLTGASASLDGTAHGPFPAAAFFPNRLATPNYTGALRSGGSGTRLMITPVQYRADGPGSATDTERVYDRLAFRAYYSADRGPHGANVPALAAAPSLAQVQVGQAGDADDTVSVSARVVGDPAAGIQEVFATYTGVPGTAWHGHWRSLRLTRDPADSTRWLGELPLDGQPRLGLRVLLQAVNGVGLAGVDDNYGEYYRARHDPTLDIPTILRIDHVSETVAYGGEAEVVARLKDWRNRVLVNQAVTIGIGPTVTVTRTDADGWIRARVPVRLTPGQSYPVVVAYGGQGSDWPDIGSPTHTFVLLPSSDRAVLTVTRDVSALTPRTEPTSVGARLTDGAGAPLGGRQLLWSTLDHDGRPLTGGTAGTDREGIARVAVAELPAGTAAVEFSFARADTPTPGGVLDLSDPLYEGATTTVTR